jgi:hypothetical protein
MRAILKAASLASVPLVVKKNLFRPFGQNFEELLAQARARVGGVAGRGIGQSSRACSAMASTTRRVFVAEVDAHELRGEIEIALARAIGEPAAFGVGDVQRLPGLLEAPGAVVGLARDEKRERGSERARIQMRPELGA